MRGSGRGGDHRVLSPVSLTTAVRGTAASAKAVNIRFIASAAWHALPTPCAVSVRAATADSAERGAAQICRHSLSRLRVSSMVSSSRVGSSRLTKLCACPCGLVPPWTRALDSPGRAFHIFFELTLGGSVSLALLAASAAPASAFISAGGHVLLLSEGAAFTFFAL